MNIIETFTSNLKLSKGLEELARTRKQPKSAIVREALEKELAGVEKRNKK